MGCYWLSSVGLLCLFRMMDSYFRCFLLIFLHALSPYAMLHLLHVCRCTALQPDRRSSLPRHTGILRRRRRRRRFVPTSAAKPSHTETFVSRWLTHTCRSFRQRLCLHGRRITGCIRSLHRFSPTQRSKHHHMLQPRPLRDIHPPIPVHPYPFM